MTALQARLDAAVDVDSLRYSGADFAEARFDAVKGRIARRRVARSAGIGGASVLGVGAVAFGAAQVPWSGFVLGANPAGSPAVLCTTSGPDAVADDGPDLAVAWAEVGGTSLWTFSQEDGTGTLATAHLENGVLLVTDFDGKQTDVEAGTDGKYTITVGGYEVSSSFAEGEDTTVAISKPSGAAVSERPATTLIVTATVTESGGSVSEDRGMWTLNGGAGDQNVGKAYLDGVTLVVESPTSATQRVAPEADGSYHFSFVGQDYVWRFSDGQSVVVTEVNTAAEPSAAPSVTCRPTTPEPSESASPSASPSPAASESAVPTTSPQPSASEQPAASPFYCGYPIEGAEYGSYDFGISDVTTVPADEINATLDRQFEILGEEWWNRATGDVLKVTLKTTDQPAHGGLSGAGGTVAGDPSDIVKAGYLDLTGQGAAFARGLGFVAVRDGVVVGTLPTWPQSDGRTYNDGNDPNPSTYFITPDGAFTACPGVELGDDWDLYAVGAETFVYADGTTDPTHYAWKKVELP